MATAIKNAVQHILPNGANGAKTNGHGANGSAKRPIKIAGCSGGKSRLSLTWRNHSDHDTELRCL
jgi:hypothetical protein